MLRKLIIALAAVTTSALLIFSIPIMNLIIKGDLFSGRKYVKTEVKVVKMETLQEPPKQQKPARKPNRMSPNSRTPKAGPRFAMDLGAVGGTAGVGISMDLVASASGGGVAGEGDVDDKPTARIPPALQPPAAIRDREIDAVVRLSFCVDVSGRAYDIRVTEESPAGFGLAESGREALSKTTFKPARKDGQAVPFCGLEQPFEIRFRD